MGNAVTRAVTGGAASTGTDAALQWATTGQVDWTDAAVTGVISGAWGIQQGVFGVAPDVSPYSEATLNLGPPESWGRATSLATHFADHGEDFGSTSAVDYASQASLFFQRSQAQGVPTKVDSMGVVRAYDPRTNEFGAFNPDGTTRTYFRPDPAGHGFQTNWDYWLSQPGVPPWQG